jgi:hypothetical protein
VDIQIPMALFPSNLSSGAATAISTCQKVSSPSFSPKIHQYIYVLLAFPECTALLLLLLLPCHDRWAGGTQRQEDVWLRCRCGRGDVHPLPAQHYGLAQRRTGLLQGPEGRIDQGSLAFALPPTQMS